MKKILFFILTICVFLFASLQSRAEIPLGGYVKFHNYLNLNAPYRLNKVGSKLQLKLSEKIDSRAAVFGAVNFDADYLSKETLNIEMVEAYVDVYQGPIDLRLGNQLIFWGKTDWLTITDNLNPWRFGAASSELEDFRIPVPAIKVDYYFGNSTLEAVWISKFVPTPLPAGNSQLSSSQTRQNGIGIPDSILENSEAGFRFLNSRKGLDWSASYFYSWNDTPIFRTSSAEFNSASPTPRYYRQQVIGLDFAKVLGPVVLVGEGAYFISEAGTQEADGFTMPQMKYAFGATYRFREDIHLNMQFVQEILSQSETSSEAGRFKNSLFSSIGIDLTDNLSIQLTGVYHTGDSFYLSRLRYSLADGVAISVGGFIFGGGPLDERDYGFFETKYSF